MDEYPNVVSVECHKSDSTCLLVSRVSLPPMIARELAESPIEKRSSRSAESLFISTHLKTYEVDVRLGDRPAGHKHYLDANIKA